MPIVVSIGVSSEADLDAAIAAANAASTPTLFDITVLADIVLTADLPVFSLGSGVSVSIDGTSGPYSIDGGGFRGFVVNSGSVAFNSFTLESFDATGGSGLGGAIFVAGGAAVSLSSVNFAGNNATVGGDVYVQHLGSLAISGSLLGPGGVGAPGYGSGIFIQGSDTITLDATTVTGAIADGAGSGPGSGLGSGVGSVQVQGSVVLSATGSYTGSTFIGGTGVTGQLTLNAAGAAGIGPIVFGSLAGNSLVIGPSAADLPTNILLGFGIGQTITLQGIGLASAAVLGSGNKLLVQGGGFGAETLAFDPLVNYAQDQFLLTPDGTGTDISLIQIAFTIASEADLNAAFAAIDIGGTSSRANIDYSFRFTNGFTLTGDIDAIDLTNGDTLTIDGAGAVLDGGHSGGVTGYRGFLVYAGTVTLENLTIRNATATGGAGGTGSVPGGGGGGLGGGLFVAAGASVTLSSVVFSGDGALGGAAGAAGGLGFGYGGGGGLGGAGGAGTGASPGGGGGVGAAATGGSHAVGATRYGGGGIVIGSSGGLAGGGTYSGTESPGAGGPNGGGGGAGARYAGSGRGGRSSPGNGGSGGVSGDGSFGGGAGSGHDAGFGGGGAAYDGASNGGPSATSGTGGWGGGGSGANAGGFGGGAGVGGGAGGGLGAGGDVFVQQGGSLTILAGTLAAGTVGGGAGSGGGAGGATYASGLFIQGNDEVNFAPAALQTVTVAGVIADELGVGGVGGSGSVRLNGPGTVVLSATNAYTGGTTIDAGTLSLQAPGAAGSGPIMFGYAAAATLVIGPGDVPAQTIGDFWPGAGIDLQGIGLAIAATLGTGDVLHVTGGSTNVSLALDPGQIFANVTFAAADDHHGGTLVTAVTPGNDNPPAILGLPATLSGNDATPLAPLAGVSIADLDAGQAETVTLTLSSLSDGALSNFGAGSYNAAGGVYTVTGSTAVVTAALRGLVFTPAAHQAVPGQTIQTGFALQVTDGTLRAAGSENLVVTALNDPPVVTGAGGDLNAYWTIPFAAFNGVTIADPDLGAVETITITLADSGSPGFATDANGTLSGSFLTHTGAGTYTLTAGSPAAVTAALDAVSFTPAARTPSSGFSLTYISVSVSDGIAAPVKAANVRVSAGLPIITGAASGQIVVPPATIQPFAAVQITDSPEFTSEAVSITLTDTLGNPTDAQGVFAATVGLTRIGVGAYTLTPGSPASVTAALDALVFQPAAVARGQTVETDFTLQVFDGGTTITRTGGSVLSENPACYAAGTRIATPAGDCRVEDLRPGQEVLTLAGRARPVRWIGWRQEDCAGHRQPELVRPVRIRAGAFAEAMPWRDLLLSPDHAVLVDGTLIAIARLLNGATIVQECVDQVTYFHVELDSHDILLAEGLPAESYLDTGNRASFANGADRSPRRAPPACAPAAVPAAVEALWRRLAMRATALGLDLPPPMPAQTASLAVRAGGTTLRPVVDGDWLVFHLAPGDRDLRLVSRADAPSSLRPWLDDRRRLGVAVARVVLHGDGGPAEWPVDHPGLQHGWWPAERDGDRLWRWTDGDARMSVAADTRAVAICMAGAAECRLGAPA